LNNGVFCKRNEPPKKHPPTLLRLNFESLKADVDPMRVRSICIDVSGGPVFEERLQDAATGIIDLMNLVISTKTDTLVLMDKSARPVAEFFKALWREKYMEYKVPEIRFVNIGNEISDKYNSDDELNSLNKVHSLSLDGKRVVVADEVVSSGKSLKNAKSILERLFSKTKNIVYTAVFRSLPNWYDNPVSLGVSDLNQLPFRGDADFYKWRDGVTDGFIALSPRGVLRKNNQLSLEDDPYDKFNQNEVNNLRRELTYLAKKIAASTSEKEGIKLQRPNLRWDLNRELNNVF
jgi:orotate phosphoribosyltransferase-like protein